MGKLIHFEITGADSATLADFYAKQLGFQVEASPILSGYHLLKSEGGISGATMEYTYLNQPVILWFEVEDLDTRVKMIVAAGGSIAGKKNTIPGQGHVQYVADPQGNIIGLKQPV